MKRLAPSLFLFLFACIDTTPANPSDRRPEPEPELPEAPPAMLTCGPLDNNGCNSGESCVWDTETNASECAVLDVSLGIEEPCTAGLFECGNGLTCTALPRDEGSSCYRVCDPEAEDLDTCVGLPGSSPNYMCMPLRGLAYGVCVGAGVQCDPNQDPCGDDEACSVRGGEAVCIPAGGTPLEGDCTYEPCGKGLVCVNFEDRPFPTCLRPCDVAIGTCVETDEVCTGVEGFNFGVCQRSAATCNPLTDDCGTGKTCSMERTDVKCVDTGPIAIGADCSEETCVEGGVCVKILDNPPTCLEPCDLAFPECSTAGFECSGIGLDFGVCL